MGYLVLSVSPWAVILPLGYTLYRVCYSDANLPTEGG